MRRGEYTHIWCCSHNCARAVPQPACCKATRALQNTPNMLGMKMTLDTLDMLGTNVLLLLLLPLSQRIKLACKIKDEYAAAQHFDAAQAAARAQAGAGAAAAAAAGPAAGPARPDSKSSVSKLIDTIPVAPRCAACATLHPAPCNLPFLQCLLDQAYIWLERRHCTAIDLFDVCSSSSSRADGMVLQHVSCTCGKGCSTARLLTLAATASPTWVAYGCHPPLS